MGQQAAGLGARRAVVVRLQCKSLLDRPRFSEATAAVTLAAEADEFEARTRTASNIASKGESSV